MVLGPVRKDNLAQIFISVQDHRLKIHVHQATGLYINPSIWEKRADEKALYKFQNNEEIMKTLNLAAEIRKTASNRYNAGEALTKDTVREMVRAIVFREEMEREQKMKEEAERRKREAERMTLNKYIDLYLSQIESGARQTDKGTNYSPNTVKAVKAAMLQWKEFQKSIKRKIDFDDIDIQVYHEYTAWLKKKNYSINSVGKCISNLKVILEAARSEEYHTNVKYTDKKFKSTRVEVDSIYLPKEDLDRLMAVDCSKVLAICRAMDKEAGEDEPIDDKQNGKGYEIARDIFMVGCWTAQRVSDYNNIRKDQIDYFTRKFVAQEPDPNDPSKMIDVIKTETKTVINIRQQKTGAKVAIPCSSQLLSILEKYDYNLPHLADQNINDYIKLVAKAAGMTEKIEIVTTKGGVPKKEYIPKYDLIHTHTARRTGATLMYLSGMDIYDIMKITGHSSPATLKKYIKANELEVLGKIMDKYNYFD